GAMDPGDGMRGGALGTVGTRSGGADSSTWEEWTIAIQARCQDARDMDNAVGARPSAQLGRDPYDLAEPPPIGEYVSLYFRRPGWQSVTSRFCTDMRAPAVEQVYPFCVEPNIGDRIQLEFDLRSAPEDAIVWLVDPLTGGLWDLREDPRVEIGPAVAHPREMDLIVAQTPPEGVPGVGFTGTLLASGSIAFPNPAVSTVTLVYGLPRAQSVSIAIFGVGGALVRTLRDAQEQPEGRHAIVWDGRNGAGSVVPRGSYFYRIAG